MIQYRKADLLWTYGTYQQYLAEHQSVFAYHRMYEGRSFLVVLNHKDNEEIMHLSYLGCADKSLIYSYGNYADAPVFDDEKIELRGWEGVIFEIKQD